MDTETAADITQTILGYAKFRTTKLVTTTHTHTSPPTSADPTHLHNADSTIHNHPTPNRLQKIKERTAVGAT